jgi:FkbM family methyltransferase
MLKKSALFLSRVLPSAIWEKIEYASAYFSGKGAGSNSLEAEIRAAAKFLPGESLVILDVGANHGDWTEVALEHFGKNIEAIYQFEPSGHNIDLLRKKFSKDPRISLVPYAVSDHAGEADLFADAPGSGMSSLHKRNLEHFNISLQKTDHVRTVTIDEFVAGQKLRKINFMKMDIEGHELAALKGAAHSLKEGIIQALSFEFGGCNIDSRTFFQDFWYFLTPLGYGIFRILPNGSVLSIEKYSEMLECFRTTNYIAVHKSVL